MSRPGPQPASSVPSAPATASSREFSRTARLFKSFLAALALEGLIVSVGLVAEGLAVGPRLVALAGSIAVTGISMWILVKAQRDGPWWQRAVDRVRPVAAQERVFQAAIGAFCFMLFLCVVATFGTSLRLNPGGSRLLEGLLHRGGLFLLWLAMIAVQIGMVCAVVSRRPIARSLAAWFVGAAALGLVLLYWYGAEGQLLFFNVDMRLTDQTAYMDYARRLQESGYTYSGDFNRMPVYPFLLTLVLRTGMTDGQFFIAAKYFNVFLSLVLLAGLAVLFRRRFSPLQAVNLILVVAFTVFVYKAGWVQSELLFYFLNTCLFLLAWRVLRKPSYPAAVAAGLVAGVAHLTKASVWPALILLVAFGVLKGTTLLIRNRRSVQPLWQRPGAKDLLAVLLSVAVFLVVISPTLIAAARITGRPFYNVNSTFYIWYDSWEQAEAGTKAHGDRIGWPDLPPDEIPSLQWYLRSHTPGQMLERVLVGAQDVLDHVRRPHGYSKYLTVYAGVLVALSLLHRRRARAGFGANPLLVLFFVSYFLVYALLYFWYAPIAAGDRLILAQYVPLLLVLAGGGKWLARGDRIRLAGRSIELLTAVNLVVLGMIAVDSYWALTRGVYILRGGG